MILSIEQKRIEPDVDVMEMHGRITMGSDSQKIEWGVAELLKASRKKVIFDLSDVSFVDSSGVGILMMCHAKLKRAGGALRLVGVKGFVEETLTMTSVDKVVPFYPTTVAAAKDFEIV